MRPKGPARNYSWPPFSTGHTITLKHGAYRAERAEQIAKEVEQLAEHVAQTYPWTAAFPDERRVYARALIDEADIRTYLDAVGKLDEKGRERPAVRTLDRFWAHAERCRAALGIHPTSAARLLADLDKVVRRHPDRAGALGDSLNLLLAEGRAALQRSSSVESSQEGEVE